ncbi:hypothetical protein LCGC14_2655250, partial [marine sediment metagenome]
LFAARLMGVAVPQSLSIVGFEDSPFSRQTWPKLTTAQQPNGIIAETAAAAVKLDPTNEEAAFLSLKFDFMLRRRRVQADKADPRATMIPVLREALRQFRTFKGWGAQKSELSHEATQWVLTGRGDRKLKYVRLLHPRPYFRYTPREHPGAEALDLVRALADEALRVPSWHFAEAWENGCQIRWIYECMLSAGLDADNCRRWRDQAILRAERNVLQYGRNLKHSGFHFHLAFSSLRCIRIEWALEEGHAEKAGAMMTDLMDRMGDSPPFYTSVQAQLIKQAGRLNDPKLAARVKRWLGKRRWHPTPETVRWIPMRWPAAKLHGKVPPNPSELTTLQIKGEGEMRIGYSGSVQALGILNRRLYVLSGRSSMLSVYPDPGARERFGYFPLQPDGRPLKEELIVLPYPKVRRDSWVEWAAVCGGKLCVATTRSGLLVFDPAAQRWTTYGAKQG